MLQATSELGQIVKKIFFLGASMGMSSQQPVSGVREFWQPLGAIPKGLRKVIKNRATGDTEERIEAALPRESLDKILDIVQERKAGQKKHQISVAKDQANFVPLSSLEIGARQSRTICRIARHFSLDTFRELIDDLEDSPKAADFEDMNLVKEVLAIPDQVAAEIFKPKEPTELPLDALRKVSESQLAKINPIPIGTGFLVGGTHLMTNYHVIPDAIAASQCVAQFNYVKDAEGRFQQTIDYEFDANILFVTNPDLDYTLVQLKAGKFTRQAGYTFGWLQLSGDDSRVVPGLSQQAVQNLIQKLEQAERDAQAAAALSTEIIAKLDNKSQLISADSDAHIQAILDLSDQLSQRLKSLESNEVDIYRSFAVPSHHIKTVLGSAEKLTQDVRAMRQIRSKFSVGNLPVFSSPGLALGLSNTLSRGLSQELQRIGEIRGFLVEKLKDLKQAEDLTIAGDRVFLVQHPKGQEKQLVQNDNGLLDYDRDGLLKDFVRYEAVSDYGSSGSPVFNSKWELVALHHAVILKQAEPAYGGYGGGSANTTPAPSPGLELELEPEIDACQGVRICRIVEDLQAKSAALPKLGSFLQDFVVTTEQLTYPPLPAALTYTRQGLWTFNAEPFVSLDNTVDLLTASTDGTLKLWNQAGIELKTLQLGGRGEIDRLCLSADGRLAAVVRVPKLNQRSPIELWNLQPWTAQSAVPNLRATLTSNHPLWTTEPWQANPNIGDLSFSADGAAIAAITIDGYIDVWDIDGNLLKSVDIFQADREADLRFAASDRPTPPVDSSLTNLPGLPPGFMGMKQQSLSQSQAVPPTHTYSEAPVVRYDTERSMLFYGRPDAPGPGDSLPMLVIESADGISQHIPVTGVKKLRLSPDGQTLYVIKSALNDDDNDDSPELLTNLSVWRWESEAQTWQVAPPPSALVEYILPGEVVEDIFHTVDGCFVIWVSVFNIFIFNLQEPSQAPRTIPLAYYVLSTPNSLRSVGLNSSGEKVLLVRNNGDMTCLDFGTGQSGNFRSEPDICRMPESFRHPNLVSVLANPVVPEEKSAQNFSFLEDKTYTLEAWVKPRTLDAGPILDKFSEIATEYAIGVATEYAILIVEGHVRLVNIGADNIRIDNTYTPKIEPNTLLHIAVISGAGRSGQGSDATDITLYINGELAELPPQPPNDEQSSLDVGHRPYTSQELNQTSLILAGGNGGTFDSSDSIASFDGEMIEVRIWNQARTQAQIQANAKRRLPRSAKAEGLVGYWRFEEIQGNQIRNLVGDGDFGVIAKAEVLTQVDCTPPLPTGLEMLEPESRVICGPDAQLATPEAITVEAWVRHIYGDGIIVSRRDDQETGYALIWQNNKIRVILQGQESTSKTVPKTVVETRRSLSCDRAFHHVAFTWELESQEIQIYVDGRRLDTVSVEGDYETMLIDGQYRSTGLFKQPLAEVAAPLVIGAPMDEQEPRRWAIAEVRLWAVARTQNQIQAAMARRLTPADSGLVGYWRLDDGDGIARNSVADWQERRTGQCHGTVEAATCFPGQTSFQEKLRSGLATGETT